MCVNVCVCVVCASVCVCACVCVCVCMCMYVCACMRACVRFAHGCWLRPHQGQGQGEGGEQREEKRGASIWRDVHFSVWCKLPSKMQALKPSTHMLRREARSGGGASL